MVETERRAREMGIRAAAPGRGKKQDEREEGLGLGFRLSGAAGPRGLLGSFLPLCLKLSLTEKN